MKKIHRFYLLIKLFPWSKLLKFYKKESENVIWILPDFPVSISRYISSSMFIKDLATLKYFISLKKSYAIKIGRRIGGVHDKNIYFSLGPFFNYNQFDDYTANLHFISNQLELQNNNLIPKKSELLYWENKLYMHEKFEQLNIRCPKSKIYDSDKILEGEFEFPFLVKTPHSASAAGVFKVDSKKELELIFTKRFIKSNPKVILQELLSIKKDLRVTIIGNEIVLHYWRVNESDEWKPTSTSHGSKVDFVSFPERWRDFIIQTFLKTGLTTGAFDVAWNNDDLDTEPYFLEVSPSYSPNPNIDPSVYGLTYGQYKKKLKLNNSFLENYIKLVFNLTEKHLKHIHSINGSI